MCPDNLVSVYSHASSMKHIPFPHLLELPLRFSAVETALRRVGYSMKEGEIVDEVALSSVHTSHYLSLLKRLSNSSSFVSTVGSILSPHLQYYCRVSPGSYTAILASVGSCLSAYRDVMSRITRRAFVLVRPPGHHASAERGEGFCLVNNIAILAKSAVDQGMKVVVIDFDRHHGNGTEEILSKFGNSALFVSSFQEGCKYALHAGGAPQNSVRIPIPSFSDDVALRSLYQSVAVRKIKEFSPDILLISAGFDMCDGDPLTNLRITKKGYGEITRMLVECADAHCGGRVISVLEGGYDPKIFMDSVLSHVEQLSV